MNRHLGDILCSKLTEYYSSYIKETITQLGMLENQKLLAGFSEFLSLLNFSMIKVRPLMLSFENIYLSRSVYQNFSNYLYITMIEILRTETILKRIIKSLMEDFSLFRDQKINNLKENILILVRKKELYSRFFESEFVNSSQKYYEEFSLKHLEKLNLPMYIRNVEELWKKEENVIFKLIMPETANKLKKAFLYETINKHLKFILGDELIPIVENNDLKVLEKIYKFIVSIKKEEFLKNSFSLIIKTKALVIINKKENTNLLVQLFNFKKSMENIIDKCFDSSGLILMGFNHALEYAINFEPNYFAELISKNIDEILRDNKKFEEKKNEEKIKEELDSLFEIFRYICAKDVFEAFYTKRLIKRMLLGFCHSFDLENIMIKKLEKGKPIQ